MSVGSMIRALASSRTNGLLGNRAFRAAHACPQNVWQTIFNVRSGLVLMTLLVGERTIVQAGGGSNLDIQVNPTVGGAVAFSAVTAVTGDAVGTIYTFTGNPTDTCYVALAGPAGMRGTDVAAVAGPDALVGWIVPPGTVQWRESAVAGTGSVQWTMFWIPIDPEGTVTPA